MEIYVLPYPGDFHRSSSLIRSLRQGPFEKFLYLDADILVPDDSVLCSGEFESKREISCLLLFVLVTKPRGKQSSQFDAEYDPYSRAPFNSGIVASIEARSVNPTYGLFMNGKYPFISTPWIELLPGSLAISSLGTKGA